MPMCRAAARSLARHQPRPEAERCGRETDEVLSRACGHLDLMSRRHHRRKRFDGEVLAFDVEVAPTGQDSSTNNASLRTESPSSRTKWGRRS